MLKKILVVIAVISFPIPALAGDRLENPAGTSVEVTVVSDFEDHYGIIGDIRRSFENHLDYILWQKGWDYTIVSDYFNFNKRDYLLEKKRGTIPRNLKLTVYPEIVPIAERNRKAREIGYHIGYPILKRLRIELELSYRDSLLAELETDIKPDKNWLRRGLVPAGPDTPTPPDVMIKEGLGRLFRDLPDYTRRIFMPPKQIPIYLYFDIRYRNEELKNSLRQIDRALEYASDLFYRQFGYGLKVEGIEYVGLPGDALEDMQENHFAMMRGARKQPGYLVATVYPPVDAGYYYSKGRSYHVGLSHIGNRHMITAHIPAPNHKLTEWESFINALLFLHETGHLMGAVHVYDASSIMYTQSPWLASTRFDDLNRAVIVKTFSDSKPLRRVDTYLELVMSVMDSTTYNKADFGLFLWEFANVNPGFRWDDNIFDSEIRRSASHALDGIRSLYHGNKEKARESLYKALSLTPDQGALHFWLGRASEGKLARQHFRKAAELGFSEAIYELMWRE